MLENLKRRGFLKPCAIVMADKGFYSYYNYNMALKRYRIVSVIWLKDNMSLSKLLSMISTLLTYFLENKIRDIIYFKKLVKILISYLKRSNELKSKRSEVEDVFKLENVVSLWTKYTDLRGDQLQSSFMLTYFS